MRIVELDALDPEGWDALAERATIFQSRPWLTAWWESFGAELTPIFLRAEREGRVVGLALLAVGADRVLRFVGDGHSDYNDLLAVDDAAADALLAALVERRERYDRAVLSHLREESWTRRACRRRDDLHTLASEPIDCPRLVMDDPELARRMRSKKSLRRHFNHFNKQEGFVVEHLDAAAAIEPWLEAFFDQHVARWAATPTPSLFRDPAQRAFYRAVVRHFDGTGALRFTRLAVEERPIAFHLGFVGGSTFTWYKPTFDIELARRSPGEALLKTLLDRAVEDGLTIFDFTIGGERFKYRFATEVPQVRHLTLYRSAAALLPHRLAAGLKATIKRSEWGRRAIARLRR